MMYYESIEHTRRNVESAAMAARIIHERTVHDYEALCWKGKNQRTFCAVADGGCNHPWFEVAVIDLDAMVQIESITFGWVKDLEGKIWHLETCETIDFNMGRTQFPLDDQGLDTKAYFDCGCCGKRFKSTIRIQKQFDQDAGYGICPTCYR
jgi:hypothetical protein